jgi:hypothetical protein
VANGVRIKVAVRRSIFCSRSLELESTKPDYEWPKLIDLGGRVALVSRDEGKSCLSTGVDKLVRNLAVRGKARALADGSLNLGGRENGRLVAEGGGPDT